MKSGQRRGMNRNEVLFIAFYIINGIASAFTPSLHIKTSLTRYRQNSKRLMINNEISEKLAIELLTDTNRDTFLHPDDDPSKPILVDAFA